MFELTVVSGTTTSTITTIATTSTTRPPCATARCLLTGSLCGDQAVPARVTRTLDRALTLIDRAYATSGRKVNRLLARARTLLRNAEARATRAAHARKPHLSRDCAGRIAAAVETVLRGLGSSDR
jgi:hypothetical protein